MIRPPFHCDYGYNIRPGPRRVPQLRLRDSRCRRGRRSAISTQIGPKVQILTADHPRDPEPRKQGLECGRPIRIGSNVWIGGGAILLPGIVVGDDAIIGCGCVS